jgi:hypothetical protein
VVRSTIGFKEAILIFSFPRDGETAAGGPSFNRYSKNPVFELQVPATTQLKYVKPQNLQKLNLSPQQDPPSTSSTVNRYCIECYSISGFSK